MASLETVPSRLNKAGLKLKQSKCKFQCSPAHMYLGHGVDSDGLHPLMEQVQVISDAPTYRSTTEPYYGKVIVTLFHSTPTAGVAQEG